MYQISKFWYISKVLGI